MTEKKDQLIGARFTKKERELIESFVDIRDTNLTEFVRTAVFSYIDNLSKNVGIDINGLVEEVQHIKSSAKEIIETVEVLKNNFKLFNVQKSKKKNLKMQSDDNIQSEEVAQTD